MGLFEEAIKSAKLRLGINRDIHAICETASLSYNYGESVKNTNFPFAIKLYKQALSLYREALRINPRYNIALYNAALVLFKMKRYLDSLSLLKEIIEIEKGTSELCASKIANNLLWTSNFESGLKFCDAWLKIYQDDINLKRVRAEILVDGFVIDNINEDGQHIVEQSSLDFFTNIIKDKENLKPSDIIFLAKIHCWMDEEAHIDYGIKLLYWGKNHYPDYWKFNFYLAAFALKYGHHQEALEEAIECKKKAPWRESVYNILAKAYSTNGDMINSDKALS